MEQTQQAFREHFWKSVPTLLKQVDLTRIDSIVLPQRGPGGIFVADLAELRLGTHAARVLLTFRPKLVPAQAMELRRRLDGVIQTIRTRSPEEPVPAPMIATESAGRSTVELCRREQIGLVDLRGTLLLQHDGVLVHLVGVLPTARFDRPTQVFRGKSARIVRHLLFAPETRTTVRQLAAQVQVSYAQAHHVVLHLADLGYVTRLGGHAGIEVRDPVGLLRAWIESGEPTAIAVERFNLRSTTPEALATASQVLKRHHVRSIFTLASGLNDEERWVSALPHAIYSTASRSVLEKALGLRPQTPHNFLVLRPDPSADGTAGGIYAAPRKLAHGEAVALPQLIVDLHRAGGRGPEQATKLIERWSRQLPLPAGDA